MKNLKIFALAAFTLLGFAACQQEELVPQNPTHTVTFVAGAPETTKTTVNISDGTTAKFAWTAEDAGRFIVYENGTKAKKTDGVLGVDGKMTLKATFDGTAAGDKSYIAVVNSSNTGQIMSSLAYDEDADILVSKATAAFDGVNGTQLQFKREVAIAKMTLKGLDANEVVNMVTVSSTADIAGDYGVEGWTSPKTSLEISSALYMAGEGYSIKANEAGEAVVWFTCIPQDGATLTVKVEAADGDTYTKEFGRAITLKQGDVTTFGVAMVKDAKSSYILYEGETLIEGDYIIVSSTNTTAMVASDTNTDGRLDYTTVKITNGTISSSLQQLEWHIAPSTTEGYWTIFNIKANAYASSTGAKNKAQLLSDVTDAKALWSCAKTSGATTYDFTNKQNTTSNVNSTLRYNGGYGFACYATSTGEPLQLYRKDARIPLEAPRSLSVSDMTVSWSPVEGAVGYRVVVGTVSNDVTVASYHFTGEADYYDVSVIALADENSETNRDSNAATLTAAKFGTPTLSTPKITAGVIDETSVAFSWTKDTRATNGYHWALYNGETLVKEATESSATKATVTDLAFGTTYTAQVYAVAVDGEKPYAQSLIATRDLTTKAKTTISTIVEQGTGTTTYAISDLTVMAVSGSNYVVKDETGVMFCYKTSGSYTMTVGDVVTLSGTYEDYQGLKEFKTTSYTKTSTATVDHGTASDLNASNVSAYVANPDVQYVKANATVASDGSLKIGDEAVYQYGNSLTSYAGRTINLYGYTLGYNTSKTNIVLLQTSVEIDQTVPYLAIDKTSKTWASDNKDPFVVKVTVNTADSWSVSPETLDWASITVDNEAGTITVKPIVANTTEKAREAKLTVTHAANASIYREVSLKQNGTGSVLTAETIKIEYTDIPSGYASSGTSGTFNKTTSQNATITIGYGGLNTKSSNGKAYEYTMFIKNAGYMYSNTALEGYYVNSVTATFSSGTGTSGKAGITLSSTVSSSRNSSVSGAVSKSGTITASNEDTTLKYWNLSTTGANVQIVSVVVVYAPIN